MQESIDNILQLIGLTNDRNTEAKALSGGMKRRLSIGISLVNDPKVYFLCIHGNHLNSLVYSFRL